MNELRRDDKGKAIQAFVLQKGNLNLTSGTRNFPAAIHCVSAGSIVITWKDDSTTAVPLADGDDFAFEENVKSVEITAAGGTFHVMTL